MALDVFAALFPRTRPSRRHGLSQSLLPVLLRLLARDEEALHESLQEALSLILPTLTPFLSTNNIQVWEGKVFPLPSFFITAADVCSP